MQLVKHRRRVMRAIIIKDVSSEDLQAMRRLQAIEGYADLGMFVEAEAELHQLDPAWFGFKQTRLLQLRVLAGLGQGK